MTRDIPWGNSAHASGTIEVWRAAKTVSTDLKKRSIHCEHHRDV